VIPAVLLGIHSRFHVSSGGSRSGSARSDTVESSILEHVESLFQKCVLEEESARVTVGCPAIRVSGLVEGLPKDFPAEGHPSADEDS